MYYCHHYFIDIRLDLIIYWPVEKKRHQQKLERKICEIDLPKSL